nr:MAG TPA: hypothetical protein [Caudoviricetes sp.]
MSLQGLFFFALLFQRAATACGDSNLGYSALSTKTARKITKTLCNIFSQNT